MATRREYTLRARLIDALDLAICLVSAWCCWKGQNPYLFTDTRNTLVYYTNESNALALFVSALWAACVAFRLATGFEIPRAIKLLRFISVCMLTVTLIVVLTVLAPTSGPNGYRIQLLQGTLLYNHLLDPILHIVPFAALEASPHMGKAWRTALWGLLPTVVYGAVMVALVLMRKINAPYPFLRVRTNPVSESLMWTGLLLGGAYLIALALAALNNWLPRKLTGSSRR